MELHDDDGDDILPINWDEIKDHGRVIERNKGGAPTHSSTEFSDEVKEIITNDAVEVGRKEAAEIHRVSPNTIKEWASGNGIKDQDIRARVVANRNNIEDLALTKLMLTLEDLNPMMIDKERDKVTVINGLSQVIERISDNRNGKEGSKVLHLHLYDPGRKKEQDYDVIEA